jgi:hypothetical protein
VLILDETIGALVLLRTATERDTFDQIWGWSQFGGALLALGALVFAGLAWLDARRSARSANRSAEAAERTALAAERNADHTAQAVDLAREELQMLRDEANRRPELSIVFTEWPMRYSLPVLYVLELTNVGNADAIDAVVNVIVRAGIQVQRSEDEWGRSRTSLVMHSTPEVFDGSPSRYATFNVDVRPLIATRTFISFECNAIPLDERGPFRGRITLTHPRAEPRSIEIEVPRWS